MTSSSALSEISVDRASLAEALTFCVSALRANASHYSRLLADFVVADGMLTITTCHIDDDKISIVARIPCEGAPGRMLIDPASLAGVTSFLEGETATLFLRKELHGTGTRQYIELRAGQALLVHPGRVDYMNAPKPVTPPSALVEVDGAALYEALRYCSLAASTNDDREHLRGVWLEFPGSEIRCVGTDGSRLHIRRFEAKLAPTLAVPATQQEPTGRQGRPSRRRTDATPSKPGVFVSSRGIAALLLLLAGSTKAQLAVASDHLVVRVDGRTVRLTPAEPLFPPYEAVLPRRDRSDAVIVNTDAFTASMRRCGSVVSSAGGMTMTFPGPSDAYLIVDAAGDGTILTDRIAVRGARPAVRCYFSPHLLLQAADNAGGDSLAIYVGSASGEPLLIAPAGAEPTVVGGNLAVIMPMRSP